MGRTKKADKAFTFNDMVNHLRSPVREFPDKRTGKNLTAWKMWLWKLFRYFSHNLRRSLRFKEQRNRLKGKVTLRLYSG